MIVYIHARERLLTLRAGVAAAFASLLVLTGCGSAQNSSEDQPVADVLHGRVAAGVAPGSVWDRQWARFAQNVAEESGGSVELEYFLRQQLGGGEAMISALRRNRVQIASVGLWSSATILPELAVLSAPYLFRNTDEVDHIYRHVISEELDRRLQEVGLKLLYLSDAGWVHVYTRIPVRQAADVRGLRLRLPHGVANRHFASALGIDGTALAVDEVIPALQTGMITGGIATLVTYHATIWSYAPSLTLTRHSYDMGLLLANRAWFDSATAEQQALLDRAFGDVDEVLRETREALAVYESELHERGVALVELTESELSGWVERSEEAAARIATEVGPAGESLLKIVQNALDEYRSMPLVARGEAAPPGSEVDE